MPMHKYQNTQKALRLRKKYFPLCAFVFLLWKSNFLLDRTSVLDTVSIMITAMYGYYVLITLYKIRSTKYYKRRVASKKIIVGAQFCEDFNDKFKGTVMQII